MAILGLDPILLSIIIALTGVGLRTWWGMSANEIKRFDHRKFSQTIVIATLVSVVAVAGNIDLFPDTATPLQQLTFVVSQVGAIIGIDMAVKQGRKSLKKKNSDDESVGNDLINAEIEDYDDMVEDLPLEAPPQKQQNDSNTRKSEDDV